jgi:site-specific recombinase XerD
MLDEIHEFVNWMRIRNPQAHTWQDYQCDLRQFAAFVGHCAVGEVTFKEVDGFVRDHVENGRSPATINRRLAALLSFYTFLSDENPQLVCPVLPHRHTLRQRRRLPRPVPFAELESFFAVIDNLRDYTMFLLMLRCGLRISEVAGLKLADVYLKETPQRLLILGKNSKERTVYLSHQTAVSLQAYLAQRPFVKDNHIFLSYQNKQMSSTAIHKRLMRYRTKAGLHLTAHQLRHTFANDCLIAEMPVTSIQKLLGHAWLTTTQTYVTANDPQVQADFQAASHQLPGWHHV